MSETILGVTRRAGAAILLVGEWTAAAMFVGSVAIGASQDPRWFANAAIALAAGLFTRWVARGDTTGRRR